MMEKIKIISISIIICSILFLSGCQDNTAVDVLFENINFDSDILKLINGSFNPTRGNDGEIIEVEVIFYLENIAGQPIKNLSLSIDFCDEQDNIIYHHPYKYGSPFPEGYREHSPNRMSYKGRNVEFIDHVNIEIANYQLI